MYLGFSILLLLSIVVGHVFLLKWLQAGDRFSERAQFWFIFLGDFLFFGLLVIAVYIYAQYFTIPSP